MDEVKLFMKTFDYWSAMSHSDDEDGDSYSEKYGEIATDKIEANVRAINIIFKCCKIPVEEDTSRTDPRCIKAFKFLLISTAWKCRSDLVRDPIVGPFTTVDLPKMTPYFLMEVVWCLEYDQILAESLLHMPLDLCLEILEIVKTCIFLWDFERGLDLVIAIILNCHKNLISACQIGTQSEFLEMKLEVLTNNAHEFMALLSNPKFIRLYEVKKLEKSERIGIIIQRLIMLTTKCLSSSDNNALTPEIAQNYRLMFGNDPIIRSEQMFAAQLCVINQDLMHMLRRNLEVIDTKCYYNWANLEARGNPYVPLQHAIRNDLYNFMQFLKFYQSFVLYYDRFIQLLKKFNPQPVPIVSALNLDGLRYGSKEMKIETIKSVIHRYNEWDHDTFDLIQRNRNLLGVNDIPFLIDYLALLLKKPGQEYHKRRVFVTIRKVLFQQRVLETEDSEAKASSDAKERGPTDSRQTQSTETCEYVKTDDLLCLDSAYSDDNFKSFIVSNDDLKSPKNMRTMLLYLLNNPRNVLQILIKVVIGVPHYTQLSIPSEILIFFYPMMKLGGSNMRLFLLEMRNVIMQYDKWDEKKFADFVIFMLTEFKFTADDFVTHVFAPWLEKKPKDLSVFALMLHFFKNCLIQNCTGDIDISRLSKALGERLTDFRKDLLLPRSVSTLIVNEIRSTAEIVFKLFGYKIRGEFPLNTLEPIDRYKLPFVLLSPSILNPEWIGSSIVIDLMYECFRGIQRARTRVRGSVAIDPDAPTNHSPFKPLDCDFARYILIKYTETELVQLAEHIGEYELQVSNMDVRLEIIDNILCRFMEAAIYFLEFPEINPPESFACLMRGLARSIGKVVTKMTEEFNVWEEASDYKHNIDRLRNIYGSYILLKNNLRDLAETIRHSTFYPLYKSLMITVDDYSLNYDPRGVALCRIQSAVEKFGNDCLRITSRDVRFNRAPSAEALEYKQKYDFINECMNVEQVRTDDASQYHSLCATFKMLRTQE